MFFDDQLDAFVSSRLAGQEVAEQTSPSMDDEALSERLVVDALAPWRTADPSPTFADVLEARMLAHATALTARSKSNHAAPSSAPADSESAGVSIAPISIRARRASTSAQPTAPTAGGQPSIRMRVLGAWLMAVAAALLVLIGAGAFSATGQTASESPPYGHGSSEQSPHGHATSNPTVEVKLCLADASKDLMALNDALTQQSDGSQYVAALLAFQSDIRDAEVLLGTRFFGSERYALITQLAAINAQGQRDLTHTLPTLSWANRLTTTAALMNLGATTPHIALATLTRTRGAATTLDIEGAGFQQGANAVVNDQRIGTVISVSATELRVSLDPAFDTSAVETVGIDNPDGTAVETSLVKVLVGNGAGDVNGA